MIQLEPSQNIIPMLGCKLLAACELLSTRKWTDAEIIDDLSFIKEELSRNVASLTYF